MNSKHSSRLILVSNRLPIKKTIRDGRVTFWESDGGLVSAIKSYFEKNPNLMGFTEIIWVGAADFSEKRWDQNRPDGKFNYKIEPIFIEERMYGKYYNGFCNATIWPLFHYFPSFADFDSDTFDCYEKVNNIFKDKITSILQPDDILWIHDYQLMLLPGLIRKERPLSKIGFFLHIPFPSYDIFRLLHRTWKDKLIHGLLGADLIGFHTHEYVQHFLKSVRLISGFDHRFREIYNEGRPVKAEMFPLGIDFEKFNGASAIPEVREHKDAVTGKFGECQIIFSVDRLDYTKGVTHRLAGFSKFLELFPEWRGKVVFIMVVVPSRQIVSKYNERRNLIEGQVSRINGKYSTLEWQPIIYRYCQLPFEELCALYQVAQVALITPLRDGMNLVAKEFVASRANQDGVLILSELAGAANELGEATLVNPTDQAEVAKAINTALMSPVDEQRQNMKMMQLRLAKNDVTSWVQDFFHQLNLVKNRQMEMTTRVLSDESKCQIVQQFKQAQRRILFLDYDGTLMPLASNPMNANPTPALKRLLLEISTVESTEIVIISGRNYKVLNEWLGDLPIHLVAEHGASFKLKNQNWQHENNIDSSWKTLIRSTFELYKGRSPGSFIEEKEYTIAWHYRGMNNEFGFSRSRELLDNLYHLIRNTHLNVLDGHKVIEVRAAGMDKGITTRKILDLYPSDFVLAAGDDKTDEDIFQVLNTDAVTIKVGMEMTAARYHTLSQEEVIHLLTQFV